MTAASTTIARAVGRRAEEHPRQRLDGHGRGTAAGRSRSRPRSSRSTSRRPRRAATAGPRRRATSRPRPPAASRRRPPPSRRPRGWPGCRGGRSARRAAGPPTAIGTMSTRIAGSGPSTGERDQRERQAGVEADAARQRDLVEVRDHRQGDQQHEQQPGLIPARRRREPDQRRHQRRRPRQPWIARRTRGSLRRQSRHVRDQAYTQHRRPSHADG